LTIEITPAAQRHLLQLDAYLSERSIAGAERVVDRIFERIEMLPQFPLLGQSGRIAGTRELVVTATNYIIAYRIKDETIQILAVLHGAQRWPRSFNRA
jgi:toxin ParE1/3/4